MTQNQRHNYRLLSLIVVAAQVTSAAELSVRQVILFKNGVGLFERGGNVAAGETVRLDFRAEEMNDVLKSLTVRDASGAAVAGVRYDSSEPLEKKLGEYPFHLAEGQPLSTLLDQLKGAAVETGTLSGVITGARAVPGANGQEREQLTLLTSTGQIRTVDLAGVTELKLVDPVLQQQFKDYLAALTASRSKGKKSVYIDAPRDAARSLSVSYVSPAPVWKSSYRLVFDKDGARLEGWAIVDNTSGEDWTNVRLALVSGRPVSFRSRLYEPRYLERAFADLAEDRALAPQLFAGAIGGLSSEALGDAKVGVGRGGGIGTGSGSGVGPGGIAGGVVGGVPGGVGNPNPQVRRFERLEFGSQATAAPQMAMDRSSVEPATEAREIGELFEYRFDKPVTVPKSESAMFPFIAQKIDARRLIVWRDGVNPLNAAELINKTGKTLDGGPLTVFEAGSYAGEALVETMKQGDRRLIAFSADQGTRVTREASQEAGDISQVTAERGVLIFRRAMRDRYDFTIRNVDNRAKTLIIEQPVRNGAKIIGAQPIESTAAVHRFEVPVPAAGERKYSIVQETEIATEEGIIHLSDETLVAYSRNQKIPAPIRQAAAQIAKLRGEISEFTRQSENVKRQTTAAVEDQTRLRENMRSLTGIDGQRDQVDRYARQLVELDGRIGTLRTQQDQATQEINRRRAEISRIIEQLNVGA